jgi:HPt (histidine-containing phosphotransfer) domain-containing protein
MKASYAWISSLSNSRSTPKDAALLASIFRTIHNIKGTCGFLAFPTLEKITHQAESLLSQLRDVNGSSARRWYPSSSRRSMQLERYWPRSKRAGRKGPSSLKT